MCFAWFCKKKLQRSVSHLFISLNKRFSLVIQMLNYSEVTRHLYWSHDKIVFAFRSSSAPAWRKTQLIINDAILKKNFSLKPAVIQNRRAECVIIWSLCKEILPRRFEIGVKLRFDSWMLSNKIFLMSQARFESTLGRKPTALHNMKLSESSFPVVLLAEFLKAISNSPYCTQFYGVFRTFSNMRHKR